MQILIQSLKMLLFMTVLTGLIYPLSVMIIAKITMPNLSQGSFLKKDDQIVGSRLIGQKFRNPRYFWGRPSAVDYNPLPSGASGLGPTSKKLQKQIHQRQLEIAQAHNLENFSLIPPELVCASGSGLDPHISINASFFQVERIAKSRFMNDENSINKIRELILNNIERPIGKLIGIPRINVLMLNIALDELETKMKESQGKE